MSRPLDFFFFFLLGLLVCVGEVLWVGQLEKRANAKIIVFAELPKQLPLFCWLERLLSHRLDQLRKNLVQMLPFEKHKIEDALPVPKNLAVIAVLVPLDLGLQLQKLELGLETIHTKALVPLELVDENLFHQLLLLRLEKVLARLGFCHFAFAQIGDRGVGVEHFALDFPDFIQHLVIQRIPHQLLKAKPHLRLFQLRIHNPVTLSRPF